jgi:hypothetical protein
MTFPSLTNFLVSSGHGIFNVLSLHLPKKTEEKQEKLSEDSMACNMTECFIPTLGNVCGYVWM